MNREIEFRSYYNNKSMLYSSAYINLFYFFELQPERFTLMQFTGLTDKNGVKIFEGDILTNHQNKKGLIVFDEGKFCIETKRPNNTVWFMPLDKGFLKNKEIIGNIYENKNLIL